tara:strand:- start:356 stop:679 length:324 start_codon:yes stop_codon:yes gene_type:complete
VVVKLSVKGIRGAKNPQAITDKIPIKNNELKEFNINKIMHDIKERYNIGSFLLPYLSPNPAKKGLKIILNNTEREIIKAIFRESNPFEESHNGQNGAFIPITKNMEK